MEPLEIDFTTDAATLSAGDAQPTSSTVAATSATPTLDTTDPAVSAAIAAAWALCDQTAGVPYEVSVARNGYWAVVRVAAVRPV